MNRQLKKLITFFNTYKAWLGLLLFVIIAYLPLSSFQFALKNDAFIYNFPNKYFFSEALQHGYIPYWNPYLNYGFPLFADPGFAWWHPMTWLFGFIGYNPYTFTLEVLFYLFIAAAGMYWLTRNIGLSKQISFLVGCLFAASGFFVGNMQHINFLTCAAFIPWVIGTWLRLQKSPSLKTAFFTALTTYLLCTAGHPAIPIGMFYFMVFFSLAYFIFFRNEVKIRSLLAWNAGYVFLTFVFLLPPILSWVQLMPFYSRSESVDHLSSNQLGFTIQSYISFISPIATIKDDSFFNTDVSMRNGYFSLFGFAAFITSVVSDKTKLQKIFLLAGSLMLVLSMGGFVKQALYQNLPLLTFIRTNGEFRVFSLLCFLISGGLFLQKLYVSRLNYSGLKPTFKFILAPTYLITASFVTFFLTGKKDLRYQHFFQGDFKTTLDQITFIQVLSAGFILALFFAVIYFILLRKKSGRILFFFILADIIINTWLLLPVTGVGQKSVAYLDDLLEKAPKGFPKPSLVYETKQVPIQSEDELRIGKWSWYDKQIIHKRIEYPSSFLKKERFYQANNPLFSNKSFAFLKKGNGNIAIHYFNPNTFSFHLSLNARDTLVLMQNYYPGWKLYINQQRRQMKNNDLGYFLIPLNSMDTIIKIKFSLDLL